MLAVTGYDSSSQVGAGAHTILSFQGVISYDSSSLVGAGAHTILSVQGVITYDSSSRISTAFWYHSLCIEIFLGVPLWEI